MKSCILISANCDRGNIYYSCSKVSNDVNKCFQWLIHKLGEERADLNKHIVYCRSVQQCGTLYSAFASYLKDQQYSSATEEPSVTNRLFAMYHGSTSTKVKLRVEEEFTKTDSKIRIVICTVSFGLGIDIPDIFAVIHWGVPRSLESYFQESGRAGRAGGQSHSIIYYRSVDMQKESTRSNSNNTHFEMQHYCSNNDANFCRRDCLLQVFSPGHVNSNPVIEHLCCDVCYKKCPCGNCPKQYFM